MSLGLLFLHSIRVAKSVSHPTHTHRETTLCATCEGNDRILWTACVCDVGHVAQKVGHGAAGFCRLSLIRHGTGTVCKLGATGLSKIRNLLKCASPSCWRNFNLTLWRQYPTAHQRHALDVDWVQHGQHLGGADIAISWPSSTTWPISSTFRHDLLKYRSVFYKLYTITKATFILMTELCKKNYP